MVSYSCALGVGGVDGGRWVNTIKSSEDKIETCSLGVVRKLIKCSGTNCV